jgi:CTP synthase
MKTDLGKENVCYLHVTLVPFLESTGELKTKPTQHSVKELRSIGIQPDLIVCRSDHPLTSDLKDKIALFCDIKSREVIENRSCPNIYQVPLVLKDEGLDKIVMEKLGLPLREANLQAWEEMVDKINNLEGKVNIALVGKYTALRDAYISVVEALNHAGIYNDTNVEIRWINAEEIEKIIATKEGRKIFEDVDGIVVPGGFGDRGIEGKIETARYAREKGIPFLGLCLGLHCSVIEFARNVCNMKGAHSSEFDPQTPFPVIDLLPGQREISAKGGTMRLGLYPCKIINGSKAFDAYNEEVIYERHRHRYELNNHFKEELEKEGLIFSGISPDGSLVEIIELKDHPWFVASQFHPEFKSRPNKPHPLFRDFVKASLRNKQGDGNE